MFAVKEDERADSSLAPYYNNGEAFFQLLAEVMQEHGK
jgi:hypothetical protein